MKIVFLSNYFNHHQKPFSNEMHRLLGDGYTFIETVPMSGERKQLGWGEEQMPSYVKRSWDSSSDMAELQALVNEADAVVIGSASDTWIRERIKNDRLVLRYSERPLKRGLELTKYPYRFLRWHIKNPRRKPIYMLCASAYTAGDYHKFGMYHNRTYRWGYFPETKRYEDIEALLASKTPTELLWCGRFLDWKHPDDALRVAGRLREEGYSFRLRMIGCGEMEEQLRFMVEKMGLQEYIVFCGSMKPEEVRLSMERAGIFLATSDRGEGWGAVLNEAMNSACAVVASHAMGAAPYLVHDGENGLLYRSGDVDMLYRRVKALLDAPEKQAELGREAYRTMIEMWNATVSAERLVALTSALLLGEKTPSLYEDGPCSVAKTIGEGYRG